MSDHETHDTIPSPASSAAPTRTDHAVPTSPPIFDIEKSDAPDWAKALYRAQVDGREEERARLERIERNQRLQLKEVRRLSRRVGDHDEEINDLRTRLEDVEDWRARVEGGLDDG